MGITFVYVTHDQEEALTLSDTIVVMSEGRIQQIGTPVDIYNEPINSFVADFIGESNILNGIMIKDKLVRFAGVEFECVDEGFGENMPVDVVVRLKTGIFSLFRMLHRLRVQSLLLSSRECIMRWLLWQTVMSLSCKTTITLTWAGSRSAGQTV